MDRLEKTAFETADGLHLRTPDRVMRLARMGKAFPTRLSFLRSLLRLLAAQGARPRRDVVALDDEGYGHAVYAIDLGDHTYSLICYSNPLSAEHRSDRVIAEAWDTCYALFDGVPTKDDIAALRDPVCRQEAGRFHERVLVLSRANKSVRLFASVVEKLARGEQPDAGELDKTGYLMRTTAVYGNGKFGIADRGRVVERPDMAAPFRLEMLAVALIREFTFDLVDHVARAKGGDRAVTLSPERRRQLGIGNSTGLGMAPFLVSHPRLLHQWMICRETALARVRAKPDLLPGQEQEIAALAERITAHLQAWRLDNPGDEEEIAALRTEWRQFARGIPSHLQGSFPFDAIVTASETCSIHLQELVLALVLEPNGELIDDLAERLFADETHLLRPAMRVGELIGLVEAHYGWALALDLESPQARAFAWYVSEEKLEPRLGTAGPEIAEHQEMPHAVAHDVQALHHALKAFDENVSVAAFLGEGLQFRRIVRRVQVIAECPYGEIRDNLVGADMRPIDLLRCKLAMFGAARFDPKSDRWTRITLFGGAPTLDELTPANAGDGFMAAPDFS